MKQATAEVSHYYDGRILTAQYFVVTDKDGKRDDDKSYAQLRLESRSELRFPLLWSTSVTVREANAAMKLFEATGVTLIHP